MSPLGITAAASTADATIQKKIYGSDITTLIRNERETKDIMKIVKYLKESKLLNKAV